MLLHHVSHLLVITMLLGNLSHRSLVRLSQDAESFFGKSIHFHGHLWFVIVFVLKV